MSFLPAYAVFIAFTAGTGASQNFAAIVITRFFGGLFASAPVSSVGGALADIYKPKERGTAVVFYSFAVCGGPTIGPLIGSAALTQLSWRWTMWISLIFSSTVWGLNLFFLPETFAPALLTQKARKLRLRTKKYALHSLQETQDLSFGTFLKKNVKRPLHMLTTEPILLCVCTYNAFSYGILYLLFEAFPIALQDNRGWSPVVSSLAFIAVLVGIVIAGCINIWYSKAVYAPAVDRTKGQVAPELRLPPMILGGILFPVGFFGFGWGSYTHWSVQIISAALIGCAFLLIFQTGINYLIDCYTQYAASALAANTFMRSIFACGLVLAAQPMFHNLGVPWANSLLGFIAIILAVVPLLFYAYGHRLRERSAFSC